ncbi:hydroxymethylglutaryl-CoA lyase [Alicyclobacillus curvatus]|nr:hydroxymethylglutaryl-CoA lyase [Alicyclobacillus curvatus]
MSLPKAVVITEVGPRDGLQNESMLIETKTKIAWINRLSEAGFRYIEVSSFVHPKWIPQLADAVEVFQGIERKTGVTYSGLVPNERGLERALEARVDAVSIFMSASETHNRKNINKSISETYPVLRPVVDAAKAAGLPVRGYVSTVFGCPYEGEVSTQQVVSVVNHLLDMGVDELSLGDTIGVAVPSQVVSIVEALGSHVLLSRIALHFHDTYGMAMANVYAGLTTGIERFDGSLGGLGGCPYAPGASGNVATDDLLYLFDKLGIQTGVNRELAGAAAQWFEGETGRALPSHAMAVKRGGVTC